MTLTTYIITALLFLLAMYITYKVTIVTYNKKFRQIKNNLIDEINKKMKSRDTDFNLVYNKYTNYCNDYKDTVTSSLEKKYGILKSDINKIVDKEKLTEEIVDLIEEQANQKLLDASFKSYVSELAETYTQNEDSKIKEIVSSVLDSDLVSRIEATILGQECDQYTIEDINTGEYSKLDVYSLKRQIDNDVKIVYLAKEFYRGYCEGDEVNIATFISHSTYKVL